MITAETVIRHKEVAGGRPRNRGQPGQLGGTDRPSLKLPSVLTQRDPRQVRLGSDYARCRFKERMRRSCRNLGTKKLCPHSGIQDHFPSLQPLSTGVTWSLLPSSHIQQLLQGQRLWYISSSATLRMISICLASCAGVWARVLLSP